MLMFYLEDWGEGWVPWASLGYATRKGLRKVFFLLVFIRFFSELLST